ncbi:MAG TPA: rhodanese-like domain-containing protein [Anaerolineaceae bacterium]|nr:rhodanese-like domain-containing protein [Anaerolineaceae bacterium]
MKKKTQQRPVLPLLVLAAGVIVLIIAVVIWLNNRNPAETTNLQTNQPSVTEAVYPDVQRVSLEDAKTAFDQGTAVFLDVRKANDFQASHIPGSISIPLAELPNRLNELDPNQWIITYCT